jgi:hypothetical protein
MKRTVNVGALICGLIFMSIAIWWFVDHNFGADLPNPAWLAAGLLIITGVIGVTGAIRRGNERAAGAKREFED